MNLNIYDWVFHFNPYSEKWEAVKRDDYNQLFNGGDDVIRSSRIETLVDIISRTNGNKDKLKELTS